MKFGTKYKNKKVDFHGFSFDSKFEASVYGLLKLMEAAGEIRDIVVKPNVHLTDSRILMIPDFKAFHLDTETEQYHEAKGFETPMWRIKLKLWKDYGPAPLHIYRGNFRKPVWDDVVYPAPRLALCPRCSAQVSE